MQLSDALNLLDRFMVEKRSRKLNPLEREILARAWENANYRDIPDYQEQTIKNNAVRLWKQLSQLLNKKVNKQNIRQLLEDLDLDWRLLERLPIESIDITRRDRFFGRVTELCQLQIAILTERNYRDQSKQHQRFWLYGMKGIGKTTLARKLAENLAPKFEQIIWISLADAPPLLDFLEIVVREVAGGRKSKLSRNLPMAIDKTIGYLQQKDYLFFVDNADPIFGEVSSLNQNLVSDYTLFFDTLNLTKHQSFWTIITTTKPSLIHANDCNIELQGLDQPSCQMLLEDSELQGTLADWDILVNKYRGNPQHLKIIANTIRDIFNGDISKFLATDVLISDRLKDCLSGQLDRLTNLEIGMLLWIAILIQERSTVTIDRLRDKFNYLLTDLQIVKILDNLVRNYLVEVQGDRFTLPDLMIECILDKYQDSIAEEIWTKKLDLLHIYPILPSSTNSMIAKLTKKSLNTQSRQKVLSQICARDRSPINIKDDLVARLRLN